MEIGSLLPLSWLQGWDSGFLTWEHIPLTVEPSHQHSLSLFFNRKYHKKNLENTNEQKEVNYSRIFSEAGEMAQLFRALAALPRTLV